ncbi:hypothetical protein XIS1_480048 [Xenorhabdus innexi]|uniref:Uncharacterized protein n=1 Tax=Xenorhabdus innexi TaxID=290109 RepID=A0A1N6MYM4_9GAMM|nr:hypothetical protein XIS1_480048 [Xenorhabdus innexi]
MRGIIKSEKSQTLRDVSSSFYCSDAINQQYLIAYFVILAHFSLSESMG